MSSASPETRTDSSLERLFYHKDRVQLVYWREFSGAKTAVFLTALITILSFVTGLSTLSQSVLVLEGPIAALLPDITELIRFIGVIFAFVLGILTYGLQKQKRLAWYLTVGMLPIVGAIPLLTLQATHIPLLLLVLVTLPTLVASRDQFDQRIELSPLQIAALFSLVGAMAYGTIGSFVIRNQFGELNTWSDAVYYVLVTIATVGYGDITPLTTEAKWFSLSVIMLGTGAFTVGVGALVGPAIEKRMATAFGNMTPSGLNILEDHVLVLGYSDITESLLKEIGDQREVVVVTPDADEASTLDKRGVNVLTADPTDEESLRDARIGEASGVVIGTRDDAQDVLSVLAARNTNPNVRVVAAANNQKNVDKLRQVGADDVISPMEIGGILLGRSVLGKASSDVLFADSEGGEEKSEEGDD